MINEADASIDVLRVKPIDQRTRIDRCCELYNVSRADGCEAGGVVRWRRGVWREKGGSMAAAPGASGVQRQEEEVTVCWALKPPGSGSGPALTPSLPAHGSRVTSHPNSPSHHLYRN